MPLDDRHTSASQLGPSAVAAPGNTATLPPAAPALHHLKESYTHKSQLGQSAIAAPADLMSNPLKEEEELTFPDLPPFPTDVPTAPLLRISLKQLVEGDESEINKVWKASQELGFFYLDLREASSADSQINGPALLKDVDALFFLGKQFFDLPTSEKQKYDFIEGGSYFGYKGLGAGVVDAQGTRDRNEFYNVSKDDMLGIAQPLPAPELLRKQVSRDLLGGYIKKCHVIVTLLLGILNNKLGLPDGKLQSLHRLEAVSGDQVRWVNSPPQPEDDRKKALGEHTGKSRPSPFALTPTDLLLLSTQISAPSPSSQTASAASKSSLHRPRPTLHHNGPTSARSAPTSSSTLATPSYGSLLRSYEAIFIGWSARRASKRGARG
jgi:hypothetical protein